LAGDFVVAVDGTRVHPKNLAANLSPYGLTSGNTRDTDVHLILQRKFVSSQILPHHQAKHHHHHHQSGLRRGSKKVGRTSQASDIQSSSDGNQEATMRRDVSHKVDDVSQKVDDVSQKAEFEVGMTSQMSDGQSSSSDDVSQKAESQQVEAQVRGDVTSTTNQPSTSSDASNESNEGSSSEDSSSGQGVVSMMCGDESETTAEQSQPVLSTPVRNGRANGGVKVSETNRSNDQTLSCGEVEDQQVTAGRGGLLTFLFYFCGQKSLLM
jgi:hypothetical protein